MEMKDRNLLLISLPAIVIILFILFFSFIDVPNYRAPWMHPGRPPAFPINMLSIYSVLMVFAVVPLSYYFMSKRLEMKIERNMKIISRLVSKKNISSGNKKIKINNKDIILKFLSPSERKVLQKLVDEKGTALQAEINRLEGMTKLKTHRIVKDLAMKGIVKAEAYGKTRRITLSRDVKDALQS